MTNTRLSHVTAYNGYMLSNRNYTMMFTLGAGSMAEEPRQKGWVLWQSPSKGDEHDFAKWFPNKHEAELHRKQMV